MPLHPTKHVLRTTLAERPLLSIPDVRSPDERIDTGILVPLILSPEPSVTLVVRAAALREHAGEVSFPGGKPERGDTDLQATALREAHEELALDPTSVDVVGRLSAVPVATSRYRLNPFVGWVERRPSWKPSAEVARVLDVPFASLASGEIEHRAVRVHWAGHEILSPFFVFEGDTRLYGATAYVLVELLSVVGPMFGFALPEPRVEP